MLRLEGVDLHYGSFRALSGVTLHAAPGELVVLLGANGAGKTSIFMAASGIHRPSAGSIRFGERELAGQRPAQIVASGLVHCPEGRKLFPMMSVRKNLTLGAYVHRRDKAGIRRYGHCVLPMDETLITAAVDLGGRPYFVCQATIPPIQLGNFNAELAYDFWHAVAMNAQLNLHVLAHYGRNAHHLIEGIFKATARALRDAAEADPRSAGTIPSTKGTLSG